MTTALHAQRRRDFSPGDFLKSLDKNGNGTIEGDEMSGRARGFIERAAERGGLDMNQPLPIDKLTEAFAQGREERGGDRGRDDDDDNNRDRDGDRDRDRGDDRNRDGDRDNDRDRDRDDSDRDRERSRSDSRTPQPRTPGFGVADSTAKAPGFDVPLGQDNAYIEKRFERKVIEYVDRMLGEQDTNKDGFIDNVEWKAGKWSTPPETSDTNNDKRLSKLELCVRIGKRFGGDREASQPSSSNGSGSGSGAPKDGGSSSAGGGDAAKFRSYAEGLIKQHDSDKSGMLEKSKGEWDKLKDDQRDADANKDSVVTLEELIVKLQAYSSGSSRSSSSMSSGSSSTRSGGSSRSNWWKKESTAKEEPKKSYRFLSPTERLPKGLPDWFARNDADADGQIMMSEFAAAWTESTAADFMKHDRDGDGIITPDEALQANQK